MSVSISHSTVSWFCVTMSTDVFSTLSTVCQYLTQYRTLVLCHYVSCCLLQCVHRLSVSHTVPSLGSVTVSTSLFYSLSNVCQYLTLYRLFFVYHYVHCCLLPSVSTSDSTVCRFCVTMSIVVFYSLSTVCQYLTIYRLLLLFHYVHCCILEYFHCLSVSHTHFLTVVRGLFTLLL